MNTHTLLQHKNTKGEIIISAILMNTENNLHPLNQLFQTCCHIAGDHFRGFTHVCQTLLNNLSLLSLKE